MAHFNLRVFIIGEQSLFASHGIKIEQFAVITLHRITRRFSCNRLMEKQVVLHSAV